MDAKIQKIKFTPVKLNVEGDVKTPEAAVIALEVPMDSASQKDAVVALLNFLSNEWLKVDITTKQLKLDFKQQSIA